MAFAGHTGVNVRIDNLGEDDLAVLFSEEVGAVLQVKVEDAETVMNILSGHGLANCIFEVGSLRDDDRIVFNRDGSEIINEPRQYFRKIWAETTYQMQSLRDNPLCARQEYEAKDESNDRGLFAELSLISMRMLQLLTSARALPLRLQFYVSRGLTHRAKWQQPSIELALTA